MNWQEEWFKLNVIGKWIDLGIFALIILIAIICIIACSQDRR